MMNVSMQDSVSAPDHVLFRELDGESVILNLENEAYFGLDDVGTRIWQQLMAQPTIQNAYDALLKEYEVEPQQLQVDMTELVKNLVEAELLEITKV